MSCYNQPFFEFQTLCVYINKYNDKFTRSGGGDELSDSSSPQTLQKMQEKERLVVVAQFIR